MIQFSEAAEKIGVDAIRYLYAGANTASEVRFGYGLGDASARSCFFSKRNKIACCVAAFEPLYIFGGIFFIKSLPAGHRLR